MTLLDAAREDYRLATALHEAGHAVAYNFHGRSRGRVDHPPLHGSLEIANQ